MNCTAEQRESSMMLLDDIIHRLNANLNEFVSWTKNDSTAADDSTSPPLLTTSAGQRDYYFGGELMNISERFYLNLKYLCKNRGIQFSDLENLAILSPGYLSRVGKNVKNISVVKAYEISKILDISLIDLLEKDLWKVYRKQELEDELAVLNKELEESNG